MIGPAWMFRYPIYLVKTHNKKRNWSVAVYTGKVKYGLCKYTKGLHH